MPKLLRDTWLIYDRSLRTTLRSPIWVALGLFQPICWLLLFAPLLEGVSHVPGFPPGGAMRVFTPGMLVMLGMYSTAFVGFGLVPEIRSGLLERLRVTPVSRAALLLGRSLRDLTVLLVQGVLLVLVATALGLRAAPAGVAASLGLVLLVGLMMSSLSYHLALTLQHEDALAQTLQFISLPLVLLSGVTLPLTLAPAWIRGIAAVNPFAHAVSAARALFAGAGTDPAVARGFLVVAPLAALAAVLAVRTVRRTNA